MRCSVLNCVNSARDSGRSNTNILFHKFPKESSLKIEWMMRCNRRGNKWNPDASYICSEHFTPDDYNEDEPGGSRQGASLKCWAIPSHNLPLLTLPVCLLERMDSEDLNEIIMKNQVKIGDLTVDELKGELKKRKIAQVGPKVALVKRLRKALTDEGEDAETYLFNNESESESTKGATENAKVESTNTETEEPKIEEKETKKLSEEVETPKRTLRRSTREKSPAIQSAPTTPSKTPRTVKGKSNNKLTALVEEEETSSKSTKEESTLDAKSEETKDKKPVKKETKKDAKKSEDEPKKESVKDVKRDLKKDIEKTEKEPEKDKIDVQEKPKEGKIVNGEKETAAKKSTEKKEEEAVPDVKKSTDKESSDRDKSVSPDKEEFEMDEEEAKQAELDLDLEDMEQPDYEEELNFDCGSTFISDNDADLDDTQDDGKNREASKKSRKSGGDKKGNSSTVTDTDVSGKPEGEKDTEEDKEKSKSSDKNISEKEDARDSEKGGNNKGESTFKDLWVTGLSSATKAADLKQAFLKHGKVISTKIVMNPKMSVSQCFGIVTVASQEDAMACVKALNVTELLGRFITVKIIAKKKDKDKDDSKKKKEDEKEKSEDRKDGSSKKESKFLDEKEKRERELRRDREISIRKRLGNPRMPLRRSPLPFAKRRQELRRQEQERRQEMVERKRAMYRSSITKEAQRQESMRLVRERELLRLERERVERDKVELLKLERERIEREKEELRRQHMRLEEVRRKREFGGPRDDFDSRSKRPMNDRYYSDRRPSPAYGGGPHPYRDKEEREMKQKKRIPEQLHVKKKNEEFKEAQPTRFSHFSDKKHRHKSRSRSKEGWKVKDERSADLYIDEKKIRDLQQIKHLIQMKQKIKQELRLSCNEKEESLLKRRKHSRSPLPSKHSPHHLDNHHIYHSNIPHSTGKSKPVHSPFISVPHHSVVTSKPSKHRLFSISELGVV